MARSRVDDEEALIPRSDQEEHHTVRKKHKKGGCKFCSIKCSFFLFLLLVVITAVTFYFIYPSFVHDNFDKFMGLACGSYSGLALSSMTCIIETTPENIATKAIVINNTWAQNCTKTFFIYPKSEVNQDTKLPNISNLLAVDDVKSFEYLNTVYDKANPTSWYLKADDSTYMSYVRLNKYLEFTEVTLLPVYVGNKIKESFGPYAINLKTVLTIQSQYKDFKKAKERDTIANLNITRNEIDEFSIENPFKNGQNQQVKDLTKVMAFRNVSSEQMYTLFAVSAESIPRL